MPQNDTTLTGSKFRFIQHYPKLNIEEPEVATLSINQERAGGERSHMKKKNSKKMASFIAFDKTRYIFGSLIIAIISLGIHFLLINGFFLAQNSDSTPKAVELVKSVESTEKNPPPAPPSVKRPKTEKVVKNEIKKPQKKQLSPQQLESLGRNYLGMVHKGQFPALIISYDKPKVYIKQMYALGCKTIINDQKSGNLYQINLLSGEILPISNNDLRGYSSLKRVVKDREFNNIKIRAAYRLNTPPRSIEIVILVPLPVEARWTGYQLNCFKKMGINVSEIATVEAYFKNSKLIVSQVNLKDGTYKKNTATERT